MSTVDLSEELYGNDPEMLAMFTSNATDLLDRIEADLLDIERDPENASADVINRVFRSAHTIKGESGFVSLNNIGRLAHTVENVLDRVREGELSATPSLISTLLDSFDRMRQMVENIETSESVDLNDAIQVLETILNGQPIAAVAVDSPVDAPSPVPVPVSIAAPGPQAAQVVESAVGSDVDDTTSNPVPTGRVRVLVIDDEPVTAKVISRTLLKAGIPNVAVETANDALREMKRGLYNVVISDLNLPDMSGVDLLPKLKGISPMVQVIMLTGDANLVTVMESLEAGAFDFLPKSQNYNQLIAPVEEALARADRWIPLMRSRR